MSRGLGLCQRVLMASFADHPKGSGIVVTSAAESRAEAVSMRRAAHTLAARGLVKLSRVLDAGARRVVIYRVEEQGYD